MSSRFLWKCSQRTHVASSLRSYWTSSRIYKFNKSSLNFNKKATKIAVDNYRKLQNDFELLPSYNRRKQLRTNTARFVATFFVTAAVIFSQVEEAVSHASKKARNWRREKQFLRRISRTQSLHKIYTIIDTDGSGHLTAEDLIDFFQARAKSYSDHEVQGFLQSLKEFEDEDGVVSFEGFANFFVTLLSALFHRVDSNDDGTIDKSEVFAILEVIYGVHNAYEATSAAESEALLRRRRMAIDRIYADMLHIGAAYAEDDDAEQNKDTILRSTPRSRVINKAAFIDFMIDLLGEDDAQATQEHLASVLLMAVHGRKSKQCS